MTRKSLDVAAVRRHFPALDANPDFVFADNAGGSQILGSVVERISEYLLKTNVQMADYNYSKQAAASVANGKAAAALFADTQPDHVMFGASATQLFETLSRMIEATVLAQRHDAASLLAPERNGSLSSVDKAIASHSDLNMWQEGEEVIVSAADHEANRGAWLRLAARLGLRVVEWPVTPVKDATSDSHVGLDLTVLKTLVTPRTRLVAVTGSSNVLGSHWSDEQIKTISTMTKELSNGHAYTCIDAVAFAPHRRLRPEQWGIDFVVWSWYKVFGPHVGSMFVSEHAKTTLLSKLNHHFLHSLQGSMYPFQPSSEQYELIASVAAVVDYLAHIGAAGGSSKDGSIPRLNYEDMLADEGKRRDASAALDNCYHQFAQQEEALAKQVLDYIESTKGQLTVLGDPNAGHERAPTVAFSPAQKTMELTSKALHANVVTNHQIGAQLGHMYAYQLISSVPQLDLGDGVMRVSFVHYNTADEVERVCQAIARALDAAR